MNLKNLSETEKDVLNIIVSEVIIKIRDNAIGCEFVRVNLYDEALTEMLQNETTERELCGLHFFSSRQGDDIDKTGQREIVFFQQEDLEKNWDLSPSGENWLSEMEARLQKKIYEIILEHNVLK